jgi:hypothetical protein
MEKLIDDELTYKIIGCAMRVHKIMDQPVSKLNDYSEK